MLHESLFKKSPDHEVDEEILQKTSSQMYTVYKYQENLLREGTVNSSLMVKSEYYLGKSDYVELRDLTPSVKLFDAPT